MSRRRLVVALAALAVAPAGCREAPDGTVERPAGDAAPDAAPSIRRVELVDSLPWDTQLARGVLHRVAVHLNGSVDTLPGVRSARRHPPVVVGDSVVLGFDSRASVIEHGFRYSAATRRVESITLPDDFNPAFSEPAVSPDGRHIAYVANTGRGRSWPVVRRWPGGQPVAVGDTVQVLGRDVARNGARWTDRERFEIVIDATPDYVRVGGSLARGIVRADTLASAPAWVR